MSSCIGTPISKWRSAFCSTPRCGAPAFAARPRRCSSTAPARRPISRRSSQCCIDAGCEVRGDAATQAVDARVQAGDAKTIGAPNISTPSSPRASSTALEAAIDHIETYGSHHTDCIITQDEAVAQRFMEEVDSAIVLHNASTQFADGGEFGFGAEIGIATGRMHARGPVGVEQLTSFKYRVYGAGQVRG